MSPVFLLSLCIVAVCILLIYICVQIVQIFRRKRANTEEAEQD